MVVILKAVFKRLKLSYTQKQGREFRPCFCVRITGLISADHSKTGEPTDRVFPEIPDWAADGRDSSRQSVPVDFAIKP